MVSIIPLRDNVPSRRIPLVTYLLILVNIVVFLYELRLPRHDLAWFIARHGLIPLRFSLPGWAARVGLPNLGYLPFLTSIFLHGGLLHLISNMWALWLFGDNVEDRLGPVRFLLLYLIAGVTANILQLYTNLGSDIPTIGASGAIAGVMGAYFVLYPRARILTILPIFFYPLIIEIPAAFYLLVWFGTQLLNAGFGASGGVAWWAHVGGFVTGTIGLVILRSTCRQRRCHEDEYRPW